MLLSKRGEFLAKRLGPLRRDGEVAAQHVDGRPQGPDVGAEHADEENGRGLQPRPAWPARPSPATRHAEAGWPVARARVLALSASGTGATSTPAPIAPTTRRYSASSA